MNDDQRKESDCNAVRQSEKTIFDLFEVCRQATIFTTFIVIDY